MCFTFLKALGHDVGNSMVEEPQLESALALEANAPQHTAVGVESAHIRLPRHLPRMGAFLAWAPPSYRCLPNMDRMARDLVKAAEAAQAMQSAR